MYLKFHVRDTVGTKLVTADYENFQGLVFGYFNAFVFVITLYKQQTRVVNILDTCTSRPTLGFEPPAKL